MSYIRLFVTLKITDNTARTALYTVKNRLGFFSVKDLRRSDFWEFSFPELTMEQALQAAERLVQKTALFVNPNKHKWRLETADGSIKEQTTATIPASVSAAVLVCDLIDGKAESALDASRALSPEGEQPASLIRGVWWDLVFADLPLEEIRQAAEKIALTKSREEGILANPHYQTYQIFYP